MALIFNPAKPEVRAIVDVCGVESIVVPNRISLESITHRDYKTIECELYCDNEPIYLDIIMVSSEEPFVELINNDDNLSATVYIEKSLPYRWRIGASVDRQFLTSVDIRIEFPSRIKLIVIDKEFYEMINGGFIRHREIVFKKKNYKNPRE